MNKLIIKILLTILLFFYIYNPPLFFLPVNSGIVICYFFFISFVARFFLKLSFSKKIVFSKDLLRLAGLILLLALYSFLIPILNNSTDFQLSKNYLSFLLFYLPGAFGIVELFKKYFTASEVLNSFISITILQSIIMISMLINPGIKDFFFLLLRDTEARILQNQISGGFRFLGFSFGATWDLSIVQSLGMMGLILNIKTGNAKINLKNTLLFLLLVVSVFLAGRTGIFGVLLSFILLMVPVRFTDIPFYKMTRFIIFLSLVTVPLFFFVKSKIPDTVLDILQVKFLPWATEMFQNDNGNVLETASSNELKTMYFVPSPKTFLVGDGYYKSQLDPNFYYMDTDGGYMRHLLFYGIFGSILLVVFYLLLFLQMYKFSYVLSPSNSAKFFIVFIGIYFFVSHIKGDLLAGADMPLKSLIFFYCLIMSFYKKEYSKEDS